MHQNLFTGAPFPEGNKKEVSTCRARRWILGGGSGLLGTGLKVLFPERSDFCPHPICLFVSFSLSLHFGETGPHYIALTAMELTGIRLPLSSGCWDPAFSLLPPTREGVKSASCTLLPPWGRLLPCLPLIVFNLIHIAIKKVGPQKKRDGNKWGF